MDLTAADRVSEVPEGARRVLLVDDNRAVLSALARTLRPRGIVADLAESAEEALTRFKQSRHPVIITDLTMPEIDGVRLMQTIQQTDPRTLFIVLTGTDDVDIPTTPALREQVASVLHKPWDAAELTRVLERCFEVAHRRRSAPPGCTEEEDPVGHVLLVEDDEADASFIEAMLASHGGVQVTRATRIEQAERLIELTRFDVILTDLGLPDARGLDAVTRLQNCANETPLVVMSSDHDRALAVETVQCGAQDFLVKGSADGSRFIQSLRHAKERKRSEHRLNRLAHYDPLTNLANRTHLMEQLERELSRARRHHQRFAVLLVDLDGFKAVNDSFGHAAGDHVLQQVAERLRSTARGADFIARLGGDEFAVVLDDVEHIASAARAAERIVEAVRVPYTLPANADQTHEARIGASVGIAMYPNAADTAATLLQAADRAMYQVKASGKNGWAFAEHQSQNGMPAVSPQSPVELALQEGQFELRFQPQIDVRSGAVRCVEALVRWQRGGQLTAPATFLDQLQDDGELPTVGQWVVRRACDALAQWRARGLPLPRIAINLSPTEVLSNDLVDNVKHALEQTDAPADCVELELSEVAIMAQPEAVFERLEELRALGVHLVIDDFGTSHASLSLLYRFQFDKVKLDPRFVQDVCRSARCRKVARAIVHLCEDLEVEVVAEGVEQRAQCDALQQVGVEHFQGFLFSRPLTQAGIEGLVADHPAPAAD